MSREITKGKVTIKFKNEKDDIVILKDFERIKYSYSTKIDSEIAKLEFAWSDINTPIEEKMSFVHSIDILNNTSNIIDNIKFTYIIKDNITLEEEEKELFDTSYLDKNISIWEIQFGSGAKSAEIYDNNLIENNAVRLKFKVE